MRNKLLSAEEAVSHIKSGMTIMFGGFMGLGTPETIVDEIVRHRIKDLTIIGNDTAQPGKGIAKLISANLVKKCIVSHIGMNPETGQKMISGEIEVQLIPQGTLIEQIRAYGAGLGGVLTQTGLGTDVQEGKQIINIDGKDYLLEKPLRADVAILRGSIVDISGNIIYFGTTRNFNPVMATAADLVIVEGEKIVAFGEIDPNHIVTPGLFVDYIVRSGTNA
jgi:acetate CoA/acetoacetate CoA-transferase alpha subunit